MGLYILFNSKTPYTVGVRLTCRWAVILKKDLTRQDLEENSHDPELNSVLIYRVWQRYSSNMTGLDATETINYSLKADDRMLDNARMYISKIASKRRRNLKVGKSHGIVYINGWQH